MVRVREPGSPEVLTPLQEQNAFTVQGVSNIAVPSKAAFAHGKPASAGTSCDSYDEQNSPT